MESTGSVVTELRLKVSELQIKLDAVLSQNNRLSEENAKLRHENNKLQTDTNIASSLGIDNRMKLHRLESENEDLKSSLQEIKIKYNKLHDRYTAKERKEKALSQFYVKHNSMPFAVPKQTRASATAAAARHTQEETPTKPKEASSSNGQEVAHLKTELAEAYDIIDGLEFELDSITFLECENERLRKELESLKFDRGHLQDAISISGRSVSSDDARSSLGMNDYETIDYSNLRIRPQDSQVAQEDTEIAVELRSVAEKKKILQNRLASVYGKKIASIKLENK